MTIFRNEVVRMPQLPVHWSYADLVSIFGAADRRASPRVLTEVVADCLIQSCAEVSYEL